MKIKLESVDLPEATIKDFAEFCGWKAKVMTTTESPNFEIDNPVSFIDFIADKFGTLIWNSIRDWNIQEAREAANAAIAEANSSLSEVTSAAEEHAKQVVSIVVE